VVACHLIEQGLTPEDALTRLNEVLADQTIVRTPGRGPETDEQRDFVRAYTPLAMDPTRAAGGDGCRPDAGVIVSRSVAGVWPWATRCGAHAISQAGSFAAVGDLLGGGPFDVPRGAWTDDTAMALLLAESLLAREGFDGHDQVQRFARWQREGYGSATGQCIGISANVARALATAQYKRQPFAGSHDPGQLDKDPLSRVAPP
jgi:hypothetical protein